MLSEVSDWGSEAAAGDPRNPLVLSLLGRAGTRPAPSSEGLGRRRGARFAPSPFLWRGRRTWGCRLSPLFTSGRPGGTCCRGPQPLGTPQVSHTWSRLLSSQDVQPLSALLRRASAADFWAGSGAEPHPLPKPARMRGHWWFSAWSLVVLGGPSPPRPQRREPLMRGRASCEVCGSTASSVHCPRRGK